MLKEIVNLGEVVNSKASVFTMKVDSTNFVKVDINEKFIANITLDSYESKEEFLEAGLFRERSSNKIILFPNSFVLEIDKNGIKTKLDFFKNGLKYIEENRFLEEIYKVIERNFEHICELGLEVAGEVKTRANIAVCVFYEGKPIYEFEDFFEKFKEVKISLYFEKYEIGKGKNKTWAEGICNILGIKDKLYYPKANFYYPFSTDKKIVKFDLRDDKNLFLVSKKAIEYFFAGKEYLENFNRYRILKNLVYITATSYKKENIKKFEEALIKDDEKSFSSLVAILNRAGKRFKEELLINFYFHTSPAQGSKEIISYIKDIMPTYLAKLEKEYKLLSQNFRDIFYNEKEFHWLVILNIVLDEEKYKRELIEIFSNIVLNKEINFERILYLVNQKSQKDRFYLSYYLFLLWIKGAKMQEIIGENYEEKLKFVIENFDLIKESDSAKIGVCVGLILKMLSFSINDYDKKVLAFVSKKLARDKSSLLKFINPIFEKAKLHQKSSKVDINIACATEYIAKLKEFNKEEFIFGLFLGDSIYNYLKDNTKGEENE